MDELAGTCPWGFFSLIPDPRAANARHRLMDILVMARAAVIWDADGGFPDFLHAKLAALLGRRKMIGRKVVRDL